MTTKDPSILFIVFLTFGGVLTMSMFWNDPKIVIAAAIILSGIIGVMLRLTLEQWLILTFVSTPIILSYIIWYPYGFILTILNLFTALVMAAYSISCVFGTNTIKSLKSVLNLVVGKPITTQVVMEPRKLIEEGTPDLIGPSKIVVKPETAIVLESGSRQTQIRGPTTFVSNMYEYIKQVFSLKPQHRLFSYNKVLSKDLIVTKVSLGITYGLNVSWEARQGQREFNTNEIEAIRKFHNCAVNWQEELNNVLEASVRRSIGIMTLDNAVDVTNQQRLEADISRKLEIAAEKWGIKISRVNLIAIQPERNIPKAREDNWLAITRSDTMRRYEKARAEAWQEALGIVAEAYHEARDNDLPNIVIYRELFRRVFEQAISDSSTRNLLPRELRDLLTEPDQDNESSTVSDSSDTNLAE